MKRNTGLDLLRCLLMCGIVVEHIVTKAGYVCYGAHHLVNWCVCGFVFMSGCYGLRFKLSKVLSLAVLGIWCAFVANVLAFRDVCIASAMQRSRAFWFLWAYIVLMCFAPFLDAAFENRSRKEIVRLAMPMVLLLWGWNFVVAVPVVRDYVPRPLGFGSCTFLSLVGCYVMARVYFLLGLGRFFTLRSAVIALPFVIVLMLCGLWYYWWIPAFFVSAFAFELFSRMSFPMATWLAPSVFSVYLLHMSKGGLALMTRFEQFIHVDCNVPLWLCFVATAIATYAVCIGVDLLRRAALHPFKGVLGRMMKKLDEKFEGVRI